MFYDPTEEIEQGEYRELPPGKYVSVIVESIWKESKKGTMMMEADFCVTKGPMEGVQIRHWLNLMSNNETAAEIARKDLHQICKAVKLDRPIESEDDLVKFFAWAKGKPINIEVKAKADGQGQMRSRITRFNVDLDAAPPKPAAPAANGQPLDDIPF